MHYHVLSTRNLHFALASLIFENYEDSILVYTNLSTELFGSILKDGQLTIENAKAATENGKAFGAFVGNSNISLVWMKCDERCYSATWN